MRARPHHPMVREPARPSPRSGGLFPSRQPPTRPRRLPAAPRRHAHDRLPTGAPGRRHRIRDPRRRPRFRSQHPGERGPRGRRRAARGPAPHFGSPPRGSRCDRAWWSKRPPCWWREGRIVAVGSDLERPEDALVVEGAYLTAGFVVAWSALGLDPASIGDSSASPATRTADALDPYQPDHLRREALEAGITSFRAQAGLGSLIAGQGAVVRNTPELDLQTRCSWRTRCCTPRRPAPTSSSGSTRWRRSSASSSPAASTPRTGPKYERELAEWEEAIAEEEEELEKDFKKAKKKRDEEIEEAPKRARSSRRSATRKTASPASRVSTPMRRPWRGWSTASSAWCSSSRTAPRSARSWRSSPTSRGCARFLAGADDAAQYAHELAAAGVPVLLQPSPASDSGSEDQRGLGPGRDPERRGRDRAVGSGGRVPTVAASLPLLASMAVGHGLAPEDALAALTTAPARALDVDRRVGSVVRGQGCGPVSVERRPVRFDFAPDRGRRRRRADRPRVVRPQRYPEHHVPLHSVRGGPGGRSAIEHLRGARRRPAPRRRDDHRGRRRRGQRRQDRLRRCGSGARRRPPGRARRASGAGHDRALGARAAAGLGAQRDDSTVLRRSPPGARVRPEHEAVEEALAAGITAVQLLGSTRDVVSRADRGGQDARRRLLAERARRGRRADGRGRFECGQHEPLSDQLFRHRRRARSALGRGRGGLGRSHRRPTVGARLRARPPRRAARDLDLLGQGSERDPGRGATRRRARRGNRRKRILGRCASARTGSDRALDRRPR